jgi:hypothetical protein
MSVDQCLLYGMSRFVKFVTQVIGNITQLLDIFSRRSNSSPTDLFDQQPSKTMP